MGHCIKKKKDPPFIYSRKTDDVQKSYFVILYMDESNRILNYYNFGDSVFVCLNPNALGYSIFNDDRTGVG